MVSFKHLYASQERPHKPTVRYLKNLLKMPVFDADGWDFINLQWPTVDFPIKAPFQAQMIDHHPSDEPQKLI